MSETVRINALLCRECEDVKVSLAPLSALPQSLHALVQCDNFAAVLHHKLARLQVLLAHHAMAFRPARYALQWRVLPTLKTLTDRSALVTKYEIIIAINGEYMAALGI